MKHTGDPNERLTVVQCGPDSTGSAVTVKVTSGSTTTAGITQMRFANGKNGRGGEIRTRDLYVPNVALYQAKLRPDLYSSSHSMRLSCSRSRSANGGASRKLNSCSTRFNFAPNSQKKAPDFRPGFSKRLALACRRWRGRHFGHGAFGGATRNHLCQTLLL